MRYLLLILVTLLLACCRTSRMGNTREAQQAASKDSIVFISMRMWHDSLQQSNHIDVLEVLTKPGSLKRPLNGGRIQENHLKCILMDKAGARDTFLIEHPLYKDVEAVDENNRLFVKRLNLKEGQFFVRFQKKKYHTLVIRENAAFRNQSDWKIKEINF